MAKNIEVREIVDASEKENVPLNSRNVEEHRPDAVVIEISNISQQQRAASGSHRDNTSPSSKKKRVLQHDNVPPPGLAIPTGPLSAIKSLQEVSELLHRRLVTSTLQGEFRNILELHVQMDRGWNSSSDPFHRLSHINTTTSPTLESPTKEKTTGTTFLSPVSVPALCPTHR
ncbi:hypothetical protein DPMN_161241 [Dreissena polymorpha]|uniref:Uncharacterized protein n=1 Tax=Dreissena polymorpha TaxID=45954 RepID=A0A9D4IPH5_DREPO|nr:hypothetical protein DPMN_161241 [Dreissena polymorpha]